MLIAAGLSRSCRRGLIDRSWRRRAVELWIVIDGRWDEGRAREVVASMRIVMTRTAKSEEPPQRINRCSRGESHRALDFDFPARRLLAKPNRSTYVETNFFFSAENMPAKS